MFKTMAAGLGAVLVAAAAAAQTPQPFPKPESTRPATSPASPVPPATSTPQQPAVLPPAAAQNPAGAPTESTLGVSVYPGAEFVGSYDAGKGQRYYLFGTNASFLDIVNYYKTTLKQKGELIYEEPAIHQFDLGKYKEETMAFPPSVSVKDYAWGGSAGYMNPKRGKQPERFKTIIQIVPAPSGQ